MEKNLFLTGPLGSGKSTAIATALGADLTKAGGFLTVRERDDTGRAVAYHIQRPGGGSREMIINYHKPPYSMYLDVFENFGVELLEEAKQFPYIVLDEIGGFEVLCPKFMEVLMPLLASDIPCIGVMKGAAPAGRMIQNLGLGESYVQKAEALRQWMYRDADTRLYECSQFDPEALRLAQAWAKKYIP